MSVLADNADRHNGRHTSPRPAPVGAGLRPDPATACSCEIDTEAGPAGPILVLRVAGEIDMVSRPLVQSALDAVLDQTPCDVVVD